MVMKSYPTIQSGTLEECVNTLKYITRERNNDLKDNTELKNKFASGRTVTKVPTSSSDTNDSRIGDQCRTATYNYHCVDDGSGNATWVRVPVETF